jgi:hypothetical protein
VAPLNKIIYSNNTLPIRHQIPNDHVGKSDYFHLVVPPCLKLFNLFSRAGDRTHVIGGRNMEEITHQLVHEHGFCRESLPPECGGMWGIDKFRAWQKERVELELQRERHYMSLAAARMRIPHYSAWISIVKAKPAEPFVGESGATHVTAKQSSRVLFASATTAAAASMNLAASARKKNHPPAVAAAASPQEERPAEKNHPPAAAAAASLQEERPAETSQTAISNASSSPGNHPAGAPPTTTMSRCAQWIQFTARINAFDKNKHLHDSKLLVKTPRRRTNT